MQIKNLYPGGFASCCYLVTEGKDAVLVDCSAPAAAVMAALTKAGATLHAILLTHGHFDHMLTVEEVKARTGAAVYLAAPDAPLPADGEKNAFSLFFGIPRSYPDADKLIGGGEVLRFGALHFRTILTPGHTAGSLIYRCDNIAFTGDTLFADGYGRCDLYGGDAAALSGSLARLRETLAPDTVIYPGHGESTTLGAAFAAIGYLE